MPPELALAEIAGITAGYGKDWAELELDVAEMERRVSDVLGSRVSITTNRKGGGELSIHFGNLYQLEELADRLIGDRGKTSLALQE